MRDLVSHARRIAAHSARMSVPLGMAFLLASQLATAAVGADTLEQACLTRVVEKPFAIELVWIPQGRFVMGDVQGGGQSDEKPLHQVRIEGFWMMRTEVTRGMFEQFVARTGYDAGNRCWVHEGGWVEKEGLNWRNPGFAQDENHPVTCVNWHDAKAFTAWLNLETGERLRLPSEAEWEYAARAGSDTTYYTGNDPAMLCSHANAADQSALQQYPGFAVNACNDGYARTAPVAVFAANPWGLHDIYGNVWEWVEDCWNTSYAGAPGDSSAYLGGDCSRRGFRGGGYGDIPRFARSTLRNRDRALHRKDDIGFRLVTSFPGNSDCGR